MLIMCNIMNMRILTYLTKHRFLIVYNYIVITNDYLRLQDDMFYDVNINYKQISYSIIEYNKTVGI